MKAGCRHLFQITKFVCLGILLHHVCQRKGTFDSKIECTIKKPSGHHKEVEKYLGMITWFIYIYTHAYTYISQIYIL